MAKALNALIGQSTALVLIPELNEQYERVIRSANNLPTVKTLSTGLLNIRDILNYQKLVMPAAAVNQIMSHLGTAPAAQEVQND